MVSRPPEFHRLSFVLLLTSPRDSLQMAWHSGKLFSAMKSTLHNSHVQKWWYPHIICIGNMQGNDREYRHVRKLPRFSFNCLVVATAASSTWRTKRHKERIRHRHLPQSLSNISKSKLQSIKCGSNVYLMPWLNGMRWSFLPLVSLCCWAVPIYASGQKHLLALGKSTSRTPHIHTSWSHGTP